MPTPLLLCMGATKAGTSWLYRALHDHPDCRLPAVKELHYWDTFEADARARQVAAYRLRLAEAEAGRAEAEAAGRGWQVENKGRRIAHLGALLDLLQADRSDDALYRGYLDEVGQGRLTGDLTPSYGLLAPDVLARMVAALPGARYVYLLRDPLARLWSHVRMQAERNLKPGEEIGGKANGILRRIALNGTETHITERGDYAGAVRRLRGAIPADRLRIEPIETLTDGGWPAFCGWLGLAPSTPETERRVHAAAPAEMNDELREPALRLLKDQYDWAARTLGELPAAWRANMARALT